MKGGMGVRCRNASCTEIEMISILRCAAVVRASLYSITVADLCMRLVSNNSRGIITIASSAITNMTQKSYVSCGVVISLRI